MTSSVTSNITKRTRPAVATDGKPGRPTTFYQARVVVGTYTNAAGKVRPKEDSKSFATRRETLAWANARVAEVEQGIVVPKTKQTVGDLLAYWMEHGVADRVTPVTRENYTYTLKHINESPLAGVPAQELKPDQIQRWYTQKRQAGCGARTLQQCHMRLSQAFKFGVRQGLVGRNPLDAVTAPRSDRKSMETWTVGQVGRFLDVASGSGYGPIYATLLYTGMRRGEALGLRWCDVDLDHAIITICQTLALVDGKRRVNPTAKTKAGNRAITIDADLVAMLRAHKANRPIPTVDGSDFVFCTQLGTAIYPSNLMRDFEHWVMVSGLPRITLHGLRHTSATALVNMGIPLTVVAERLGHAKTSTTMDLYAHVHQGQHKDAADRLSAAFGAKKTV
jgi:integrase